MSEHSDSGSSRLSGWALVNRQGELEGSDEDSSTKSGDIVEQGIEEEELGFGDLSRETTPECIELEQLMRKADAAEKQIASEGTNALSAFPPQSAADENESHGASSLDNGQLQEVAGACCAELLQSAKRRQSTGEGEVKLTVMRQSSQDSDSPASSTSILSLSDISSLSTTSKSSRSDSDSESDFVRLEKESSCVSTESEGEEPILRPRVSAMTASGSSVGSGFNFLSGSRAASLEPPVAPIAPAQAAPPSPPLLQPPEQHQQQQIPSPQQAQHVSPEEQPLPPPQHQEPLQQQHPLERPPPVVQQQPQPQQPLAVAAGADDDDADDGDTESSNEDQDQDDRIESEQSDDAHSAQVDDVDEGDMSVLNDFGDLPLVLGDVERHYIHHNNQHLNGYLNRIVLAVIVLALGMGLGHWIGSTQEHFTQLEIQLSQMKRLHLLQDKYVQCLAHNDELHLDFDALLEKVTDQMKKYNHGESDLRNNNQELQKQLQEAQNQLQQVLASIAKDSALPKSTRPNTQSPYPSGLMPMIDMAKLLIASEEEFTTRTESWDEETVKALQQARQSVAEEGKREKSTGQERLANKEQLRLVLQEARQQINSLQNENAELRVIVGRMRYNADGVAGKASLMSSHEHDLNDPEKSEEYSLPPPPNPIPPPPLVEDILEGETKENKYRCVEPSDCLEEHGYDPDTLKKAQQHVTSHKAEDLHVEVEEVEDIVEEMQAPHIIVSANPEKPTVNAGTPQPVPVDVTLLQRNLSQEQQRADMWRRLYLSARAESRKELPINGSACVQYLMQQMNVSTLMHSLFHWNLTGAGGTEKFTDLTNLVASIVQLQRNLVDSLPSVWEEISSTLHGFHGNFDTSSSAGGSKEKPSSRKGEAEKEQKSEEHKGEKNGDGDGSDQSRWSESVKKLLNKTRGTLSNVSRQIQQTWGQVKNASRQLWPSDDSVLSRMAARVKKGMSKLSRKVQNKASRWLKKSDKHFSKKKDFEEDTTWEKSTKDVESKKAFKKPTHKKELKKKGKKSANKIEEQNLRKKDKGKKEKHDYVRSHGKHGKNGKRLAKENVRPSKHHPEDRTKKAGSKSDKHFRKFHGSGSKKEGKGNHHHKKHMKQSSNKRMKKASKETQFHSKDHSSHTDKDAFKLKRKFKLQLEEQFQNLFSQVGYLGLPGFSRMDKDDLENIWSKLNELFLTYNSYPDESLSRSAHDWLKCQSKWFGKAVHQHLVYQPVECSQYLTPWQLTFAEETRVKLATGECQKKLIDFCYGHDCIDLAPEFTEDHYRYVCKGDGDYDGHPGIIDDTRDGKHSSSEKNKPRPAPKGRKEDDLAPISSISRKSPNTASSRDDAHSPWQKINQTENDHTAWYFDWLEGRDNLRAGELKADWIFERAVERHQSRQRGQMDNWIFERASNRDTIRGTENQDEEDADDSNWHSRRKDQHKHKVKTGHFKQRDKKHQHEWSGDNYQHHGRNFRQKYGRATFCNSC